MRQHAVRWLLMISSVLLLSVAFTFAPRPVRANSTDTYDFKVAEYGATVPPFSACGGSCGSWDSGSGFKGGTDFDSYTRAAWQWEPPTPLCDVLTITVTINQGYSTREWYFDNPDDITPFNYSTSPYIGGPSISATDGTIDVYTWNFEESDHFTFSRFQFFGFINGHYAYYLSKLEIVQDAESEYCGGPPPITRPLTSDDEVDTNPLYDQTGIYDNPVSRELFPVLNDGGIQSVSAWSKVPGAKVHAADAGSIVSVKPLAWDDCGIAFASPTSTIDDTTVYVPFESAQNQPCVVGRWEDLEVPLVFDTYWLDASNVYIVTLMLADNSKIQYLVRNAPNYVVVGDTVDTGCVLGETIPLTTIPTQAINFAGIGAAAGLGSLFTGGTLSFVLGAISGGIALYQSVFPPAPPKSTPFGYTMLSLYAEDDSIQELASRLGVEPTNDDPCNNTGDFRDCLAFNPRFTNGGDGWVASGNVEWTEPGVILDPGESVTATINLSSTGDYTATAFAQGVDGAAGEIRLYLGTHTQRYPSPTEWTSLQLTAEPLGEPDAGTFYTVGVQNTGPNPVEVASLCVTDGAPNLGPNSCYFNNQSFVQGTSGWTVSDGVEPVDQGLNVPDNGTISQSVMLNPLPGGAATYHLVVRGNWWYNGALDTTSSADAIASIKYEWPDGTGYQEMIPINIHGNLAYGAGQLAFQADIEVSTTTDALMNLKVETTTAGDMGVLGIQITDACLTAPGGGGFPGQGDPPPETNSNCSYVSRPQNNDPAAWLQWHWNKSEQFFKCDLMVLLNKMYTLGKQSYLLAGWQMRYTQSTMKLWSTWLGKQLFPWFNGQFRNIAIGQVTTIYQSGGTCNDLFCLLNNVINSLLAPLVDPMVNAITGLFNLFFAGMGLALTVLRGVISLGLAFLHRIFDTFNHATGLLTGLIGAFNTATPVTIEGMPTCTVDPTSSLLCRVVYMMDNTAFNGRWGVLFTIVLAILGIHLIIWVIGEFRDSIVKLGGSS